MDVFIVMINHVEESFHNVYMYPKNHHDGHIKYLLNLFHLYHDRAKFILNIYLILHMARICIKGGRTLKKIQKTFS